MPSPTFTFRLPENDKRALVEIAKVYGKTPGAFLAEFVGTVVSGDMGRIAAFNVRLGAKLGEQLTLSLNSALEAASETAEAALDARKRPKRRKERPRRGKRS